MPDYDPQYYQILTDLIDQSDTDYIAELRADTWQEDSPKKSRSEIIARTRRNKTADIALRSLRILANTALISGGDHRYADRLQKDFDDVLEAAGWLTNCLDKSDQLVCEAIELILLTDPASRGRLLRILRSRLGVSVRKPRTIRTECLDVGLMLVRYYQQHQLMDAFKAAAAGLVALSHEYSRFDPGHHRPLVTACLSALVDHDPQLTLRICQAQKSFFRRKTDAESAAFYWYYGFSSQAVGRRDEALPLLLESHRISLLYEGERSWQGARALQMYHRILFDRDKSSESEGFLWDFIEKTENHYYPVPELAGEVETAFVRSQLLLHHLVYHTLSGYFPQIRRHLEFCTRYEQTVRHPALTVCSALNILSGYYLETGDFLQAEQKMLDALHSDPPPGVAKRPSDDLLLSNLLHIYSNMNDSTQMEKLADILSEKLDSDELSSYERYRYFILVLAAYAQMGYSIAGLVDDFREALLETYEDIRMGNTAELEEGGADCAYSVATMIVNIVDNRAATEQDLHCYQAIFRYFLDHPRLYSFTDAQLTIIYQELARISWILRDGSALGYIRKSLEYGKSISDVSMVKTFNMRMAASIFYSMGQADQAVAVSEEALHSIEDAWHNVISFINDHRICQVLEIIQENYNVFYAVISARKHPEAVYDQLLRCKDLPSLVGRERNRYLNDPRVDRRLRDRVYALQDQLADAQMSDALQDADTVDGLTRELQEAEAAFAQTFPRDIHYTGISFDAVARRLKEDEAIIEYYFTPGSASLNHILEEELPLEMDIFVVTNRGGKPRLDHIRRPDGDKIIEDAAAFTDAMQHPDDPEHIGQKELLRERLYHSLLGFALEQVGDVSTLYIAPDLNLCNLPFEILFAGNSPSLQDAFRVCRLVCGRDLLFFDDTPAVGSRAFILGDPDFETERGEISNDRFRHAAGHLAPVCALPFSGIEAQRVARRCRTTPCIGSAATKYALQEALPARIIHLATHGSFDEKLQTDSLYSSYLVFAGYNRWLRSKTPSRYCGNGILTADEISRMDLRRTELVVLSACNSGMGDYSDRTVKGLLSAFSAAGVRWVISHIWEAEDFTTPILMDAFYDAYLRRGMDVPEALQYAKNYLRTVTIRQLRMDGWLDPGNESRLSEPARLKLMAMHNANDRRRPFMDESNWGGFVCYKCK